MTHPATGTELLRNRSVQSGLILLGLLTAAALLGPLATHDPFHQFASGLDDNGMPLAPSSRFLFGTDSLERDVFSRVLHGARLSLLVGTLAMLTATLFGVGVGLLSGYCGRWVDTILMRCTDIMMSLPSLLLAMALAGLMDGREVSFVPAWSPVACSVRLQRGVWTIILVIALVSWTGMARVVRGQVLSLKERPFVEAARALGCSHLRIVLRHILPNVLPAILVLATLSTAGTVGMEAGLSFLGIGMPPAEPSWGGMINEGQPYLLVAPWLVLPPGIAILLAVLGFNLLGQGLQEVLDPHGIRRT